jgi:plastocyanin/mono/diheme cytochrome c family protein
VPRRELVAIIVALLIIFGLPGGALGYRLGWFTGQSALRTIDIVAAAPESGGFQPDVLRIPAGETVRLRFSVPDVTHSIAIGPGLGIDLGEVDAGQVKETQVTFPKPGRYTLYCYTWCSPNHWRMRATIEVYDLAQPEQLVSPAGPDPVIAALAEQGIDVDVPHPAAAVPAAKPSASRGEQLVQDVQLPAELDDAAWRRAQAPAQAHDWLMAHLPALDSQAAWDIMAFLWLKDVPRARLEQAGGQYAKTCAACHGETGNGEGPGLEALRAQGLARHHDQSEASTALDDPHTLLGGTSTLYYAKIRKGGMGTGMPDFGPILTEDETWALVDYLWTFQFEK